MKKIACLSIALVLVLSCQGMKNTVKGTYQKQLRGVTPADIRSNTRKIIINKYHFVVKEEYARSTLSYTETAWKKVPVTDDEKKQGFSDVRVRLKIRSRETRGGPTSKYDAHSLKFLAEVEAYQQANGSWQWIKPKVTPQREDYLERIFRDYKLEFNDGVNSYN